MPVLCTDEDEKERTKGHEVYENGQHGSVL